MYDDVILAEDPKTNRVLVLGPSANPAVLKWMDKTALALGRARGWSTRLVGDERTVYGKAVARTMQSRFLEGEYDD